METRLFQKIQGVFIPILENDKFILPFIIAIFTGTFTYLSYLRYEDFYTTNWDLGINLQSLWTTTHGYLLFYTEGGGSFLEVHSTYVAILVSVLYGLLPYPTTLFLIQSFVVSLSIIPLYLIGKEIRVRRDFLYFGIIVYLFNFGLISGMFYDFHWEMFLPVEFFTMFYLLQTRRIALSLIPFIIGCATLEVFPFLSAAALIYFLFENSDGFLRNFLKWIRKSEHITLLVYLGITAFAYLVIRILQLDIIPHILGSHGNISAVAGTVTSLFSSNVNDVTFSHSLWYWLLLYASMGFISVFYLRHLILAFPWLFFTIFINPNFSIQFGNQYAAIAIIPLAIGLIFGLKRLENLRYDKFLVALLVLLFSIAGCLLVYSIFNSKTLLSYLKNGQVWFFDIIMFVSIAIIVILISINNEFSIAWITGLSGKLSFHVSIDDHYGRKEHKVMVKRKVNLPNKKIKLAVISILALLLALNLVLSPLNTHNFNATPFPGYQFSYSSNPAFAYMHYISDRIPPKSTVVAADNLFPFVANNPNAYSILWFPSPSYYVEPTFPFNSTDLPRFVLTDSSQITLMPGFLITDVFNSSLYDLDIFIYYNGYPGSIYLFKLHSSATTSYYNASEPGNIYYFGPDHGLSPGPSGRIINNADSMFHKVIESNPATNLSGNGAGIWFGPYSTFYPGKYEVTMSLKGGVFNNTTEKATPVFFAFSGALGGNVYYSSVIDSGQLSPNTWSNVTFMVNIQNVFPLTWFNAYIIARNGKVLGYVMLNFIEVQKV